MNFTAINFYLIMCIFLFISAEKEDQRKADHLKLFTPRTRNIMVSGGPLSALTCCVNARLLSAIKKISPLIYSQSWVVSWVYTTQAMMTFTLIF